MGIWFELEPELVAKRQAEEEKRAKYKRWPARYIGNIKWAEVPMDIQSYMSQHLVGKKAEQTDFMTKLNRYQMIVLFMEMSASTKPEEILNTYVDDPHELAQWQQDLALSIIEQKKEQK